MAHNLIHKTAEWIIVNPYTVSWLEPQEPTDTEYFRMPSDPAYTVV